MSDAFPDGMITRNGRGDVCRVFAPPRWALWRWVRWLCLPASEKCVEERLRLDYHFARQVGEHVVGKVERRTGKVRLVVEARRILSA